MKQTISIVAVASCLALPLQAQDLPEGTWSGTRVRVGGGGGNQQPQRISLEVKRAADPHAAWRPDNRQVLNVTFVGPQQGRVQATDVRFDQRSLSFSYRQEIDFACRLDRQGDGAYQGDCLSEAGGRFRVTLNPPKPGA
jgi:hypothetical protein